MVRRRSAHILINIHGFWRKMNRAIDQDIGRSGSTFVRECGKTYRRLRARWLCARWLCARWLCAGGDRRASSYCSRRLIQLNISEEALGLVAAVLVRITWAGHIALTDADGVGRGVVGAPAVLVLDNGKGVGLAAVVTSTVGLVVVTDWWYA